MKSNYNSEDAAEPCIKPREKTLSSVESEGVGETEVAAEKVIRGEIEKDSADGLSYVRDPDCTECGLTHPDPTPDQLIMYLHALRYTVSSSHSMYTHTLYVYRSIQCLL